MLLIVIYIYIYIIDLINYLFFCMSALRKKKKKYSIFVRRATKAHLVIFLEIKNSYINLYMRIINMLLKLKNMNLVDFYIFKNISYNFLIYLRMLG